VTDNIEALQLIINRFQSTPVRIEDADGTVHTESDPAKVMALCLELDDPWIDLVGDDGVAIGIKLHGDAVVVFPQPSYYDKGSMIYLFAEGEELEGQEQGKHMLPVADILDFDTPRFHMLDSLNPISTPGSDIEITLSNGRHRQEKQGGWKPIKSTFAQFATVLQDHREGKKDGPCFLQGECVGGTRKAMAMSANGIIGVDLDSGKPLEDVMNAIIEAGLEAVVYTTHSHLKNQSQIKRDHFLKWADTNEPTVDLVREYLMVKKGMIPEVLVDLEIVQDALHTEEGVVILVKHNPIPKFRAVFPLHEPFVFAARGGPQKDAITEWKERYAGFATKMGFFFDETCVDPARLFYLPRHPKGAAHGAWWVAGTPVNLDQYERLKITRSRKGRSGPSNAFTEFAGDEDEGEADRYMIDGVNLVGWAAENAKLFEVETFLTEKQPEVIREERSGKPGVHIECPFEAEHSTFGGGGCFVVGAGDNYAEGYESGFTFTCVHDACSGRDRLDMLKGCIEEGWFTAKELDTTDHLLEIEIEDDDEPVKPAKKASDAKPASDAKKPVYEEGVDDEGLDDETRTMNYFNHRYAVVSTSGGAKILVEPEEDEMNEDGFQEDIMFYTQTDVALIEKNRFLFIQGKNGKTERMEAFKAWLESPERRTYKRVTFEPGKQCGPSTYNLFQGFPIEPIKGDWSLLRNHIFENICDSNDELFDWFMTWMAQLIQKPNRKPGSSIVVMGGKGTGKSTTFDYLSKLLGRHALSANQRKQIIGNFNAHLQTALLLVCEEAFWAADPQGEGTLKDMITAEETLIEKKGYDPIKARNYTRIVLISNSSWVVPASLNDERRFGVFRCSDARQGDLVFWDQLREQMDEEGGLQAMMYDLLHYQPATGSFACLFTPPATKYLQSQQIESLTGVDKFMLMLLKAGVYEPSDDNIDTLDLADDKPTLVPALQLRKCVQDFLKFGFASDKAKTNFDDLSKSVLDWFGVEEFKMDPEGARQTGSRAYRFPPLAEARASLKERQGLDIEILPVEKFSKR
jgi:hypothetical protein